MDALGVLKYVLKGVEMVRTIRKEHIALHWEIDEGLDYIKSELSMLTVDVEKAMEENYLSERPQYWILLLQELAYDIQDFVDARSRDDDASSAPAQMLRAATLTDPSHGYVSDIKKFKERLKMIEEHRAKQNPGASSAATTQARGGGAMTPAHREGPSQAAPPVGIEKPVDDLVELLSEANRGGHHSELKVISILGCAGLGKTTLAWALYGHPRVNELFPDHRAMVEAPSSLDHMNSTLDTIRRQCGYRVNWRAAQRVLRYIRQRREANASEYYEQLKTDIQELLRNKRYFIIIDGLEQRDVWEAIDAVLPKNNQGSRVVVTTRILSVARGCSSGSYLYTMRGLDKESSADLLWDKLGYENNPPPALQDALKTFFDKCEGLPVALVGTSDYLASCRARGSDLRQHCKVVGDALGSFLTGDEPGFRQVRTTLARCCDRVREHGQKMCMLSVSSYRKGKGHQLHPKSLIRRWIAEGILDTDVLLEDNSVAINCLDKLLDLGIVEPVPCDNSIGTSKVKRCQVHSVMREFLVHRAASWNFIKLIDEGRDVKNPETHCTPRRLCINGDDLGVIDMKKEEWITTLDRIRSLTIWNSRNLRECLLSCRRLRFLDLENCKWLCNNDLHHICQLLHLKYLSLLRNTQISVIPETIKDLHCLETFDVRGTSIDKLPLELMMLPQITHLFGKFELPAELGETVRAAELEEFFSAKSKLKTLAGFKILNKNRGFELILLHASKLKKVKIWSEVPTTSPTPSPSGSEQPPLTRRPSIIMSLPRFLKNRKRERSVSSVSNVDNLPDSLLAALEKRFIGTNALESVSINFSGDLCKNFLERVIKDPCAVSSIKVWGRMETLPTPPILETVRCITELHLCDTGLHSEDLSRLQSLPCLVHLKIAEKGQGYWSGRFDVMADGFPSLHQLCFDGPKIPDLTFERHAKSPLMSLQIICLEPADQLGVAGIIHLKFLNEVVLHRHSSPEKMEAWKQEALEHKNRPYVKKQHVDSQEEENSNGVPNQPLQL